MSKRHLRAHWEREIDQIKNLTVAFQYSESVYNEMDVKIWHQKRSLKSDNTKKYDRLWL